MPGPTRPDLIFGVNNRHPASVGTGTDSLGTVAYEEQSSGVSGSGVGFGQRLAVRHYENFATSTWLAGSDPLTKFNGGRMVATSVSGSYILGSHDSDWNALFDRMYALDFGGNDTSGAGTKKPLVAPLCLYHEIDRWNNPNKTPYVKPADYIAAFKNIRALRNNRATAAGVPAARVPMMTISTAYGVNIGRFTPYWPGDDQVDLFGVDGYSGLDGGPWALPAGIFGGSIKFAADHGDKDIWICETSVGGASAAGHDKAAWWSTNFLALVNSTPKIKAVFAFQGPPGGAIDFDKTSASTTHAGMLAFLASTGANAGYSTGSSTQLKPTNPTGVTFTSDASGTFGTLTWAANPSGDNVTLWDVYQAPGKVTTGFTKLSATSLPAAPRSYNVTGLTPGTAYSFTVVAVNSVGRSGFGNVFQGVTSKPGPTNLAPVILSFSADVDATDPTLAHFTSSASDPNGDPLTFSIAVAGPNAFTTTLTGPNVDSNFDPGSYLASLTVSDGRLSTTQVVSFHIADGPLVTPDSGYELPQPGDDLRDVTRIYRNTIPDLDARITRARRSRSSHNSIHGWVGSTFDPVTASNASKTAFAAQDLRWYWMKLEDETITGLSLYLTDAQIGTGTSFCVHAADGSQLCAVQSGATVDAGLQTVGDTEIDLDVPVTGRTAGGLVVVGFLFPSGVTPPKTYVANAQSVMGQIRLGAGFARGNLLAAQSAYPDVLPFASASPVTAAFVALY